MANSPEFSSPGSLKGAPRVPPDGFEIPPANRQLNQFDSWLWLPMEMLMFSWLWMKLIFSLLATKKEREKRTTKLG